MEVARSAISLVFNAETRQLHALPARSNISCKIQLAFLAMLPVLHVRTCSTVQFVPRGTGWKIISVSLVGWIARSAPLLLAAYAKRGMIWTLIAATARRDFTGTPIWRSASCVRWGVRVVMPLVPVFPVGKITSILIARASFSSRQPLIPPISLRIIRSWRFKSSWRLLLELFLLL